MEDKWGFHDLQDDEKKTCQVFLKKFMEGAYGSSQDLIFSFWLKLVVDFL
jgi:hypothetical protein